MANKSKSRKDLFSKSLTMDQFNILKKVMRDVFFFATLVYIVHPMRGRVLFKLYSYQKKVLYYFLKERFNIILKFRQAGLSELIALYSLWLAMYHPHKNIQIISIKDKVAKRLLARIKFMYKNLPEYLQVQIVNGKPREFGTVQEIEFSNGSRITSVPTTEDAGRSEAVSLLVIDEAAIVRYANTIWAAAFPTLSTGGSAIINSTPFGMGNWYHKTWVQSMTPTDIFHPIRLKWTMHPERDMKWYKEMATALGPRRTSQEIDGNFLTSGYSVFDLVDIKAIEDELIAYEILETRYNGCLRILKRPEKNRRYYIGADISTGRARDYSAFSVMDQHGEEYAFFKGRVPVEKFTEILNEYGRYYNNALLAPEANDIGLSVVVGLQQLSYPNLYYTSRMVKEKGQRKPKEEKIPGWLTHTGNRSIIIDELEADIREDNVIIKDPFFCDEAYTFIYDNKNKPIAMGKGANKDSDEVEDDTFTDDAIMAKAITNHIRKTIFRGVVVPAA